MSLQLELCAYYFMNKQYVKGVQKWKMVYLKLMDYKMVIAMLVLLFDNWGETKTEAKRARIDFWDCHKPGNRHAHFSRETIIYSFPT